MHNTRAYRSKIGRLPWALRNEINHMIRDGRTGTDILARINSSPEWHAVSDGADVNPQNLSDWRTTGYADWLSEQDKTEHIRQLASLSQQIVEQSGGDPAAVGSRILAGNLLTCLEAASPADTVELAKALTSLRTAEINSRRADIQASQLDLRNREFTLEQARWQRQTCELYLKWYADQAALNIVTDRATDTDAKTEALGRLMFGDLWESK